MKLSHEQGDPLTLKLCLRCATAKSVDAFHRSSERPGGRHPYCKRCRSTERKARYARTRPRERAQQAIYARANAQTNRDRAKKWKAEVLAHDPERQARYAAAAKASRTSERMAAANARQRDRGRFQPGWTADEWVTLLDFYGHRCLCCGATGGRVACRGRVRRSVDACSRFRCWGVSPSGAAVRRRLACRLRLAGIGRERTSGATRRA